MAKKPAPMKKPMKDEKSEKGAPKGKFPPFKKKGK